MKKTKVFIMKGTSCSGKSLYSEELSRKYNATIISSDEIGEKIQDSKQEFNGDEVFNMMEKRGVSLLKLGKNIIIDSTNLTPRRTKRWICMANRFNASPICVYICTDDLQMKENILKRIENKWTNYSERKVKRIVFDMKKSLHVPNLCEDYEEIIIYYNEGFYIDNINYYRNYFKKNEDRLINDTRSFMKEIYDNGIMEKFLPELYTCVGFEQHNSHHTLTVFEHILKSAELVKERNLKMIWTMLLHDIGKAYPGVKSRIGKLKEDYNNLSKGSILYIEKKEDEYYHWGKVIPKEIIDCDDQFHYYNHQNFSAQLACSILNRLGYDKKFIIEVITLVQYHMDMPNEEDTEKMKKFKKRMSPIYEQLKIVRQADASAK